jgi:predicted nucleic acid-binding Zn ribbon protein
MYCRKCGNEILQDEKNCLNCGEKNSDFEIRKKIIIWIIIGIGILILIGIYIGISNNNSSQKTFDAAVTNEDNTISKETSADIVFDARKLIGAKKQDVDALLNINGTQDANEPYVYHYGEDTDVVYDDNGICLDLCLDTDGKGYKSYDETKIFKSYGIDLTDSYYKQQSQFLKTYSKIKDFGEIDVFYNSNKGGSSNDIKQIIFYTKSSKELNDFLEKKSESFENELDSNIKPNVKSSIKDNSTSSVDNEMVVKNKEEAIKALEKSKKVDYKESSAIAYPEMDKVLDGVKYYYIEVASKGGRGAAMTYYVNSKTGDIVDLLSQQDIFNKISNSK